MTDIVPGEQILVVDNTNGERLWTYAIEGDDKTAICMNGAAAHKIGVGDQVIIMAFSLTDEAISSKNILVDRKNRFVKYFDYVDEEQTNCMLRERPKEEATRKEVTD